MRNLARSPFSLFAIWAIGLFWGYFIGKGWTVVWFGTVGSLIASFLVGVIVATLFVKH